MAGNSSDHIVSVYIILHYLVISSFDYAPRCLSAPRLCPSWVRTSACVAWFWQASLRALPTGCCRDIESAQTPTACSLAGSTASSLCAMPDGAQGTGNTMGRAAVRRIEPGCFSQASVPTLWSVLRAMCGAHVCADAPQRKGRRAPQQTQQALRSRPGPRNTKGRAALL